MSKACFYVTNYLSDLYKFVIDNGYLDQIIIFDGKLYNFIEDTVFGILSNESIIDKNDMIQLLINKYKNDRKIILCGLDNYIIDKLNKTYGLNFIKIKEYGDYNNNKVVIRDLKKGIYRTKISNDIYAFLNEIKDPISRGDEIKIVPVVKNGQTFFYASTRNNFRFFCFGFLNFEMLDFDIKKIKEHIFNVDTVSFGKHSDGEKYQVIIFRVSDELSELMSQLV